MSEVTPPIEILDRHLELLSGLHALFLEEGALLRSTGGVPDEAFLERKRAYLDRLDQSLAALRSIGGAGARLNAQESDRVREARKRMLQVLILDRENERMLLKATVSTSLKHKYAPVLPGRVAKVYGDATRGATPSSLPEG